MTIEQESGSMREALYERNSRDNFYGSTLSSVSGARFLSGVPERQL
jgi:hypothetical protein